VIYLSISSFVIDVQTQMKEIDSQITKAHKEGYSVEVDRLLEERLELQESFHQMAHAFMARS